MSATWHGAGRDDRSHDVRLRLVQWRHRSVSIEAPSLIVSAAPRAIDQALASQARTSGFSFASP